MLYLGRITAKKQKYYYYYYYYCCDNKKIIIIIINTRYLQKVSALFFLNLFIKNFKSKLPHISI